MINLENLEVGGKVKIKGDLKVNEKYGSDIFVKEMEKYNGEILEVTDIYEKQNKFEVVGAMYYFTPQMCEKIIKEKEFEVGDKVKYDTHEAVIFGIAEEEDCDNDKYAITYQTDFDDLINVVVPKNSLEKIENTRFKEGDIIESQVTFNKYKIISINKNRDYEDDLSVYCKNKYGHDFHFSKKYINNNMKALWRD